MTMIRTMLVAAIAAALLLGGCGNRSDEKAKTSQDRAAEKAIEKSSGGKADVNISKGKMTIETKTGEKVEVATGDAGVKVPADFPKDILVYPGAKVMSSVKAGEGMQLILTTSDALAKVADAYKAEMKKSGWDEKGVTEMSGMTMLQYSKGEHAVMVHISGNEKTTEIMLMVTTEKQPDK